MKNILDTIIAAKHKEVAEARELYPLKLLEKSIFFNATPVSMEKYLKRQDLTGIIAEFKRQSPSRGLINAYADPATICLEYMQAGAAALSVLTDTPFFGGHLQDLRNARKYNYCPILRKDFMVDEYQIIEARSIGADAVLLISEVLTSQQLKQLSQLACSLGMEVLFEIHDEESLQKLPADARMVGINNRNLNDFSINQERCLQLSQQLPLGVVRIAESGINQPQDILKLRQYGFHGFLIGERFMREAKPGLACRQFIQQLKTLEQTAAQQAPVFSQNLFVP